jgi:glycerol-3-phosphate dehydrogenase (NAD(P)+)
VLRAAQRAPFKRASGSVGVRMEREERIAVVGGGSFGTVLAAMLARKGHTAYQWVRSEEQARAMEADRENRKYLPGHKLPLSLWITSHVEAAVRDATIVVAAVPSFAMRETARMLAPHLESDAIVLNVAKGVEPGSFKRMSEVLRDELPASVAVATLSGPNLALEMAQEMPSGAIIASEDKRCLPPLVRAFENDFFKVYAWTDLVGVELGGVLKNITAIAAGISDGIGYGDNSKASLITLGLAEMFTVGNRLGAKRNTFYGLAGLGDLVATCSSKLSRNHFVGEHLGKGETMEQITKRLNGKIAEGVNATRIYHEFARRERLSLPITEHLFQILYEGKPCKEALVDLLRSV